MTKLYDQLFYLTNLLWLAVYTAAILAVLYAAGILVVFEDLSFRLTLGSWSLAGCVPWGICYGG